MEKLLTFILVSPEKEVAREEASSVVLTGVEGEFTALVGHAPFVTLLRPGYARAHVNGEEKVYAVLGGFVEVAQDVVSVLADEAYLLDDMERGLLERKVSLHNDGLDLQDPEAVLEKTQYLSDLRQMAERVSR